jgi:DNA invertase Pin-like site-specific DNA recombinase
MFRISRSVVSVKAALYARVSTDDGRQTVANQVRQLRELAAARDFEIFREYTDEETGASANRASFLALLRDARLRRFRVLLITDLDRLTREGAAAGFAHLAELDRYGVRVVSLGQGWLDYDPRIDEDPEPLITDLKAPNAAKKPVPSPPESSQLAQVKYGYYL